MTNTVAKSPTDSLMNLERTAMIEIEDGLQQQGEYVDGRTETFMPVPERLPRTTNMGS